MESSVCKKGRVSVEEREDKGNGGHIREGKSTDSFYRIELPFSGIFNHTIIKKLTFFLGGNCTYTT